MSSLSKSFKLMKKNLKAEVEALANREWQITYKDHNIRIVNTSLIETIYIDDVLVVEKKHKSMLGQIKPYVKLTSKIPSTGEKLTVKIGGINQIVCSVKVGSTVVFHEKTKIEMLPWQNKQPIYTFLLEAAAKHEDIRQITLPDEGFYYLDDNEPRFALGLQMQITEQSEIANLESKSLIKKLHALLAEPTNKNRQAVYEKVMDEDYIEYDRYFLEVFKEEKFNKEALKKEAMWFIKHATHRYAFIFGLEILRFTDYEENMQELKKIALHEDFTLFIVELMGQSQKSNGEIFELAQQLEHWGRIFAINFMKADREEHISWLTTDGYNGMFPELFAEKANIHHLLEIGKVSSQQYKVIGEIIVDLIKKGDIDNYDRASDTILAYSKLAENKVTDLHSLYPITVIHDFLTNDEASEWEDRYEGNWQPIDRILITKETAKIVEQNNWQPLLIDALTSTVEVEIPLVIAKVLKINVSNLALEKLENGLYNSVLYDYLVELNEREIMKEIIGYLEKDVSVETVTPEQIGCIESAIYGLEDFSGLGISLLEKFIEIEDSSIQYSIIATLDEWDDTKKWMTPVLTTKIEGIAKNKADKELRQLAKQFLKEY